MGKRSVVYPDFKASMPKLDGKVFVITGTTSGTGFIAAQTTAELGGEVVLLNRESSRSADSLAKLKESVPEGKFVPIACDLQDFSSVKNAAKEVKSKYKKIYCLANNAGIMATPDKATVDGYDTQMQTNHLSHFLLTKEFYPLLVAGAKDCGDARIVNHSSLGRNETSGKCLEAKYLEKNGGNLGGDELKMMAGPCFERYFHTKLANSVFTYALHEKLTKKDDNKVRVVCAHPGVSDTNLGNHMKLGWFMDAVMPLMMPFMTQTPEDGAVGLIKGMMDPESESGVLYGPKNNGFKGPAVPNPPQPYENDEEAMKMLWDLSEAATGVKFNV